MRIVPGIIDELVASSAKAARAHAKPAADKYKAVAELPEVPDYEYIMPPPKEVSAETMSKEELKVRCCVAAPFLKCVGVHRFVQYCIGWGLTCART